MSKKLYAALLPVLAVVAFASMSTAAQAVEFHWYACEEVTAGTGTFSNNACTVAGGGKEFEIKQLPFTSAKKEVDTFGTLTVAVAGLATIECKVIDAGNIWNEVLAAPGKDEITEFVNFGCKLIAGGPCATPKIVAKELPWLTELAAGPVDKIKGIKVTLFCGGAEAITLEGELKPTITNPTVRDPMIATFTAATGELTSGATKATVTGHDRIVGFAHGENIFVKMP